MRTKSKEIPSKPSIFEHMKRWEYLQLQYEVGLLRRESQHLYKKSSERALSLWELDRKKTIGHEIAMLDVTLLNFNLEQLLAA